MNIAEIEDRGFHVGIVGARAMTDYGVFKPIIDAWIAAHGRPDVIVSGGAVGADSLAERYAEEHDIAMIMHLPKFFLPSPQRYYERNRDIVDDSDYIIAFPSLKLGKDYHNTRGGTQHTMRYADGTDTPLDIYWMEEIV